MLSSVTISVIFCAGAYCIFKNGSGPFQWLGIEICAGIPIFVLSTDLTQFLSSKWPGNLFIGSLWLIIPSLIFQFFLIIPNLVLYKNEINDSMMINRCNKSLTLSFYCHILNCLPKKVIDGILSHHKSKAFFSYIVVYISKCITAFFSAFYLFSGHRVNFENIIIEIPKTKPEGWTLFMIIVLSYAIVIYSFHQMFKKGIELILNLNKTTNNF